MKVRVKRLNPLAPLPSYANPGDAGLDLTAVSVGAIEDGAIITYHTGIAVEIPEGYVGLVFSRSSVCKKDVCLANCVGVIDSCYRGEILLKFRVTDPWHCKVYNVGDKIGQLVIVPCPVIEIEESAELSETQRGEGGFGSSDKK